MISRSQALKFLLLIAIFFVTAHFSFRSLLEETSTLRTASIPPHQIINHVSLKKKKKVKATILTLARNGDLGELLNSIQQVEDAFNKEYKYPWTFLNDVDFDEDFKRKTTEACSGPTEYITIPKKFWSYPPWIDQQKAKKCMQTMADNKIIYGGSLSYRHMCRFESGFFWQIPQLNKYEYYWRVEPSVKYYCKIDYDIFQWMKDNDKDYGFAIALHEYKETIPTLWETTLKFISQNPKSLAKNNALNFISEDGGKTYNGCHFWSNFEIAKFDLWRKNPYKSYFEFLDKAGGFFYERWGDAPVHSIGASLFMDKRKIHFFDDVGYYHVPLKHCPNNAISRGKCSCTMDSLIDWNGFSCLTQWYKANDWDIPQ